MYYISVASGGSRISQGRANSKGALTYYLTKFPHKLHEKEEILVGGRPLGLLRFLDLPLVVDTTIYFTTVKPLQMIFNMKRNGTSCVKRRKVVFKKYQIT